MIYFLGDIHGQFDHVRKLSLSGRPDAVVFLGDIESQRPFMQEIAPLLDAGIEVRWIRGNHDTDTQTNWDHLADAMHLNIDGKVCELNGIRIAGLGGVFRREIWLPDPANPGGVTPCFTNFQIFVRALKERPVANSLPGVIDHLDARSGQAELTHHKDGRQAHTER